MARKQRVVTDHSLRDRRGRIKLSRLFGRRRHLVVLHNMGKDCPNCALFGDEMNGVLRHLERAAAFCVVGPDDPRTQARYARGRGWKSRMASAEGSDFIRDMGFQHKDGGAQPGVSVLEKKGGRIRLLNQVNVMRDGRCPSALEVLWMIPGVKPADLAWRK
jgi:predicted dithiol-disulfide oxidoreductase (DUF899 family)